MRYLILTILSCFIVTSAILAQSSVTDPRSGIEIIFVAEDDMFPDSWMDEETNGKASSLDPSEYDRSAEIVQKALDKYPVAVLTANLKKIYVVSYLNFFGVGYGGTNSNDVVYMSNQGVNQGYTDYYIEQTFHHEFSSILMRNYADLFFESKWEAINKTDFTYGEGGVTEITEGKAGTDFDIEFHREGFLYQYAMSGVENDLNSIAENLFCPDEQFWTVYENYPRVKQKVLLTIKLYNSIDDKFCKEYFLRFKSTEE